MSRWNESNISREKTGPNRDGNITDGLRGNKHASWAFVSVFGGRSVYSEVTKPVFDRLTYIPAHLDVSRFKWV